jgi:hypothetical protein
MRFITASALIVHVLAMGVNALGGAVIIQPVMSDLAKKLGLRPGDLICVLEAPPEAGEVLRQAFPPGAQVHEALQEMRYNVIPGGQQSGFHHRPRVRHTFRHPQGAAPGVTVSGENLQIGT